MSQVDMLSINAVAAKLGLSVHQLRRWELMFGLEIKRGRGQQRQYRSEDMSVLERIKELVEQGWPTSQIRPQLEAEGLVTPKLIGLPPPPGNPEVLMEALIGFRNFTERRFIEISRQIDELRQLMISITLKQELNGETSSPWQPMQREFAPEPKASPEQEFNIGPDYSAGPPVEFTPPPPPPQRQAIIPPVSATPPAESTFEVGPSSSSFGSSFSSTGAPPERTKIIGEPTPPALTPKAPFDSLPSDEVEDEEDFEDDEDFEDENEEVTAESESADKAPIDKAIASDFPSDIKPDLKAGLFNDAAVGVPEKAPSPFPSFESAEKPASTLEPSTQPFRTASDTGVLSSYDAPTKPRVDAISEPLTDSSFSGQSNVDDVSETTGSNQPEPPSSLTSDFLLTPPQPSPGENEFAPDTPAGGAKPSSTPSSANDMFSSVAKSGGVAARESALNESAAPLPALSEIPGATAAPIAPVAPAAPPTAPIPAAQPPLMPDLGSNQPPAPASAEPELPSFLSNPPASPSSTMPTTPLGGSTFVPPTPTPQPQTAGNSPFITPPQPSSASPFLTPPPAPYMSGGQPAQPANAFEPPQQAQTPQVPAPQAPPPAPVPSAIPEAPKPTQSQVQKGPFLGEITDQNYLTILGRALDLVGWSDEQADSFSVNRFKVPHWDELGRSQAEVLIEHLLTELQSQMGSEG